MPPDVMGAADAARALDATLIVDCGAGRDRVRADRKDKHVGCEVRLG